MKFAIVIVFSSYNQWRGESRSQFFLVSAKLLVKMLFYLCGVATAKKSTLTETPPTKSPATKHPMTISPYNTELIAPFTQIFCPKRNILIH